VKTFYSKYNVVKKAQLLYCREVILIEKVVIDIFIKPINSKVSSRQSHFNPARYRSHQAIYIERRHQLQTPRNALQLFEKLMLAIKTKQTILISLCRI